MSDGLVALTVDGGPYPRHTPAIVDVLVRHGARATFFLVGYTAHVYPEEVCAIRDAGMEIGNHTMNHRTLVGLSRDEIQREVALGGDRIEGACGVRPTLFRPPWGEQMEVVQEVADAEGVEIVPVRGGVRDFFFPPVEELAERIVETASDGDLLTLHSHVPEASAALELALPRLADAGLRCVAVGDVPAARRRW